MTRLKGRDSPKSAIWRGLGISALALGVLLGAHGAEAQQVACAPHDAMAERLGARFAEAPASKGLASSGKLVELFTSEDGGTWTLVLTEPRGVSCIVAAGKYWYDVPAIPTDPEA